VPPKPTRTPKPPTSTATPRPPKTNTPQPRATATATARATHKSYRTYTTKTTYENKPALKTPTPPPQALVFEHTPVRLFVEFKDGSGVYTVDVLDADANQVKNLFKGEVTRAREDWVDWDLTDDWDRKAPSGTYQMVIRKGGRELKRIWMVIK
jgi:hypothetical protein